MTNGDNPAIGKRIHADGISTNYAGAGPGRLVALISSRGTLEIAVAQGSAAACTGAERGTPVIVETV